MVLSAFDNLIPKSGHACDACILCSFTHFIRTKMYINKVIQRSYCYLLVSLTGAKREKKTRTGVTKIAIIKTMIIISFVIENLRSKTYAYTYGWKWYVTTEKISPKKQQQQTPTTTDNMKSVAIMLAEKKDGGYVCERQREKRKSLANAKTFMVIMKARTSKTANYKHSQWLDAVKRVEAWLRQWKRSERSFHKQATAQKLKTRKKSTHTRETLYRLLTTFNEVWEEKNNTTYRLYENVTKKNISKKCSKIGIIAHIQVARTY